MYREIIKGLVLKEVWWIVCIVREAKVVRVRVWIMTLLLACNASCSCASYLVLGSTSRIIESHCIRGVIIEVRRGGNVALDQIGESDTRNDTEVVVNDASPCCTGVYGEEPAVAPMVIVWPSCGVDGSPCCISKSVAVSWCFHFHAL